VREIAVSPTRTRRFHRLVLKQLAARAEAALRKLHEQNPLRSKLERTQLAAAFRYLDDAVFSAVLNDLRQAGRVQISGDSVALTGHGPKLSQNERKLLDELIPIFRQAGMQSPSVEECQQRATKSQQSVAQLLALAAANGDLVEIAAGYYLHRDVDRQLQTQLRTRLGDGRGATLSEIREWLATTRKYAVPYCEYLDRIGFTRRDGDRRFLAQAKEPSGPA
jgi:selenocysteine-specific elongation factor